MLDVNILGTTALGMKHGLRAMRPAALRATAASIINVASVAATIAFPGIAIYSGTKSAVDRMTRVAAMEAGKLGYGVRVNCIYPGLVPTAMGAGLAKDVADLGLFPSPEAAVGAVVELTPPAGSAPSRTWPTSWCSWPPTRPASSPAPACRSTAAWGCEDGMNGNHGKPVVVYGASGYTGRLICEYLREYNVPFVAAGRSEESSPPRCRATWRASRLNYDVVAVEHHVATLTALFKGASVVLNTVGPFATHGLEVVEACLNAGTHYLDTTGEQDWLITCDEK